MPKPSDPAMTYHGDCVWCCGCPTHPLGKPWGWNHAAWDRHYATEHPASPAAVSLLKGTQNQ